MVQYIEYYLVYTVYFIGKDNQRYAMRQAVCELKVR